MNALKIGTLCILSGCFAMLVSPKIGTVCIGAGVILMITAGDEKEAPKPVPEKVQAAAPVYREPHYRVVGSNMLMLDEEGNVIGSSALPVEKKQRKLR